LRESGIKSLAQILKDTLHLLDQALDSPPFNFYIHTSPILGDYGKAYHWHIEILPRLTKFAGFELGTGIFVNPVPPEDAAALLRETLELKGESGS
jgi:UDPglucose--hexose-1-phosphate uridylyltransferase